MANPRVEWGVLRTFRGAPAWCCVEPYAVGGPRDKVLEKQKAIDVANLLQRLYPEYAYRLMKYRRRDKNG